MLSIGPLIHGVHLAIVVSHLGTRSPSIVLLLAVNQLNRLIYSSTLTTLTEAAADRKSHHYLIYRIR